MHQLALMKGARTRPPDIFRLRAIQDTTTGRLLACHRRQASQCRVLRVTQYQARQGTMGVDTRHLLLRLDTSLLDPDTLLLDLDTLLLDPDTLLLLDPDTRLLTPILLHQPAPMEGLLHSPQLLMMRHTSTEITLLLSSQEHPGDMVTAAVGGRAPSAYSRM